MKDCGRDVLDLVYGKYCCQRHENEVERGIQQIIYEMRKADYRRI